MDLTAENPRLLEDFVAEATFFGQHIMVVCSYDTYQSCWSSKVFLVGKTSQHRLFIPRHETYSSTKLGSIQSGLRLAKFSIMSFERPVCTVVDNSLIPRGIE